MLDPGEVATALHMRANWIETGNVALSRNDAIARKMHKTVRALDEGQLRLVAELRGEADRISSNSRGGSWTT